MRNQKELTRVIRIGMSLVLPLGLAVCAPEEAPEWAPDPMVEEPTAEPITVDIRGIDTDVSGEATVSRVGESLMVSLNLEDMPPQGPFQAQILAGRCDDWERMMPTRPGVTEPGVQQPGVTEPDTTPGMQQPGVTDPGMQRDMHGQALTTLDPVQVIGETGTSTTTVPVRELEGHQQVFILVEGPAAQPIACGDIDNLGRLTQPGMAPGTTQPGTQPR